MSETRQHSVVSANARMSGTNPVKEYLAFVLDAEHYAIDILRVQEIRVLSQ